MPGLPGQEMCNTLKCVTNCVTFPRLCFGEENWWFLVTQTHWIYTKLAEFLFFRLRRQHILKLLHILIRKRDFELCNIFEEKMRPGMCNKKSGN